jgi:2-succinyl-5-enolpyruvyl-6-hydroxy-3-cyclohexene-1-carboxylate synthase
VNAPAAANTTTYVYTHAFVDELWRAGIQHVVICPGSRSTPLTLTFAAHPTVHTWLHIDERAAAFFALGMAKRSAQCVALLCTSGTAAANFLPALVEAKLSHIPLLVLTADRPYELRECGAPQAIDQQKLYGTHVKWFVDVALPEATNTALRYIRTLANRAAALAQAVPAGPVHLNMPFREPLTPAAPDTSLLPDGQRDAVAWEGRSASAAYVTVSAARPGTIAPTTSARLATTMSKRQHGLIVVGPNNNAALTAPLLSLAQRLGYPILADPLSQLRCASIDHTLILSSYDAFLRSDSFAERTEPELVLRFGALPTSKPLLLYLQRYAACPQIVIESNGGWEEPAQLALELIHVDAVSFCQDLFSALADHAVNRPSFTDREWLQTWQHADQITREVLASSIQDLQELFEGRIFTELAAILPNNSTLYVGNSMPVRDLDTFFWCNERKIHILGNRGANGIDGVISSALGASAATASAAVKAPVVLVIGDLSFFHDLNGLLAAHLHKLDLTIVLVNNDGGGIFSFLPQAAYPEYFEQFFGTPTGLDFRPVVQMYGGNFQCIQSWAEFREALKTGIENGGLHVIELHTERASNVSMHRQLWQAVSDALEAEPDDKDGII